MLQVRVHGPGDVRVDDVPRTGSRAPTTRWCESPPVASVAATCPTSASAGWPDRAAPRCASATRSPATVDWVGADVTTVAGRRAGGRAAGQRRPGSDRERRTRGRADATAAGDRGRPGPAASGARRATARRSGVRRAARGRACTPPSRRTFGRATGCACSAAARSAWPPSPLWSTGATTASWPSTSAPPASISPWGSERRLR